jgi:hypothetical protein
VAPLYPHELYSVNTLHDPQLNHSCRVTGNFKRLQPILNYPHDERAKTAMENRVNYRLSNLTLKKPGSIKPPHNDPKKRVIENRKNYSDSKQYFCIKQHESCELPDHNCDQRQHKNGAKLIPCLKRRYTRTDEYIYEYGKKTYSRHHQ